MAQDINRESIEVGIKTNNVLLEVTGIDWDAPNDVVLPLECSFQAILTNDELNDGGLISDYIANHLSDEYEYCQNGFNYTWNRTI